MRKFYENCLLRNRETNVIQLQGFESVIKNADSYIEMMTPLPTHKRVKLLFHSLGYSYDRANIYRLIFEISKLSILTTKKFNTFFIGEGELGKSFLLLNILDLYKYKMTGELNLVHLRGSKTAPEDYNIGPLLENPFLILEEQFKNLKSEVISLLKDSLENGNFKNNKDNISPVSISLITVGNTPNDTVVKCMEDLTFSNILENFNKTWTSDKAAMQRIDAIFPHFSDLLGVFKGERNFYQGDLVSTIDLKDSLLHLQQLSVNIPEKFLTGLGSREKLSIEKLASSLIKILFPDKLNNLEEFQYKGIIEISKHFYLIGSSDKNAYNPFNDKSIKFICSLVTSVDTVEFIQILENRLIVKKESENIIRKYALNGFGIKINEQETELTKNFDIILPIIACENKGWLLKQELNPMFKYNPYDAIYFNNYKRTNLTDEAEHNEIILKLYELTKKNSYLKGLNFKGIPYHIELKIKKELEKHKIIIKNISNIRDYIAYDNYDGNGEGKFKLVTLPNI